MGNPSPAGVAAEAAGWLDVATPLPGDGELAVHLGSVRTQPGVASLAEPHRERITRWSRQGIQGTTIHGALVRSHGFTGSYSSVHRFLAGLEAAHPQVTTVLEFDPGEAAQVDFGKGPGVLDPRTGELLSTWIFVMTLAWSRHAYAEIITDQKVATWLGCRRPENPPLPQEENPRNNHPVRDPRSAPVGGSINPNMGGPIRAVSDNWGRVQRRSVSFRLRCCHPQPERCDHISARVTLPFVVLPPCLYLTDASSPENS